MPLTNQPATTPEYRFVVELCPPTPGYLGFSPGAIRTCVAALKQDPTARKAFRYQRNRKLVFGFAHRQQATEFEWSLREMFMNQGAVHERAFYTDTDLQP